MSLRVSLSAYVCVCVCVCLCVCMCACACVNSRNCVSGRVVDAHKCIRPCTCMYGKFARCAQYCCTHTHQHTHTRCTHSQTNKHAHAQRCCTHTHTHTYTLHAHTHTHTHALIAIAQTRAHTHSRTRARTCWVLYTRILHSITKWALCFIKRAIFCMKWALYSSKKYTYVRWVLLQTII